MDVLAPVSLKTNAQLSIIIVQEVDDSFYQVLILQHDLYFYTDNEIFQF
jgi:hypothetical protein